MKWLVTAFEPFGGGETNSSLIVAKELQKLDWNGEVEFHFPVPTRFASAWPSVREALKPGTQGVLALGQAETRSKLSLERVALNWIDARIADNAGFKPGQGRIEEGPDALWSPIPWERLEDSAHWERSYSAGTFVCNMLLYQLLNWSRANGCLGGFVHVPLLSSQADPQYAAQPRMADQIAAESLARLLRFLVNLK